MLSFYKQLKSLRESIQKTQQEVCQDLNIEQSTLANYENGRRIPRIEILIKLAEYYKCSIDYLLGLDHTEVANLNIQKINNQLSPDEETLLQAFNQCSEECKQYLIAKTQVLSVEGISAVATEEYGKYIDQEKKSRPLNGTEETGS